MSNSLSRIEFNFSHLKSKKVTAQLLFKQRFKGLGSFHLVAGYFQTVTSKTTVFSFI